MLFLRNGIILADFSNNIRYVIFFRFFSLFKTFFKRFICLIKQIYAFNCFACMYVCITRVCLVPVEVKREGHQVSRIWSFCMVVSDYVGVGN